MVHVSAYQGSILVPFFFGSHFFSSFFLSHSHIFAPHLLASNLVLARAVYLSAPREPKDEPEPEVLPTVLPAEVVKAGSSTYRGQMVALISRKVRDVRVGEIFSSLC